MRPKSITIGLSPSDADGICTTQGTAAAAELDLSGGALSASVGVARMATATQITITCAADETAREFTITGKDSLHRDISEKVTGVNAAAATSALSYTEVSRIEIDGATSGNVSAGISGDADAIFTNATLSLTGAFTLNGIFTYESTMFGIAENIEEATVKIYSAGDDSGDTFTIYGQDGDGVDISEAVTGANAGTATSTKKFKKVYAILDSGASAAAVYAGWADDPDGIAKSQTMAAGGYLVMNGSRCTTQARHVSITSAGGDESGITFTVSGLDRNGVLMTEDITGPAAAATVKGDKNFATVQAIYADGNLAGDVTVGSADECESQAIPVDYYIKGISVQIAHSTSSSLTHRFLDTLDNVISGERDENTARWVEETGTSASDEALASTSAIKAVRLEITSHVRGSVDMLMAFPGAVD